MSMQDKNGNKAISKERPCVVRFNVVFRIVMALDHVAINSMSFHTTNYVVIFVFFFVFFFLSFMHVKLKS